jgi:RHS repeat-associated protein
VATGLVYMQQRYYDPIAGRFLSVDPVTTNAKDGSFFGRYHYANNNPFKFKDPDGRAPGSFDCDCSGGTTNAGLPVSPIVTLQILAHQSGASPAAVKAVAAMAAAAVTRGKGGEGQGSSRTKNHHREDPKAEGRPHSVYRQDSEGKTTSYETYNHPEPGVGKRVDVVGAAHNGVPTPHVTDTTKHTNPQDPSKSAIKEGPTRPATPDEVPKR